jgi:hypothetical protein
VRSRNLQARFNQIQVSLRRLGGPLGLLLERVEHIDRESEPDRVDASVGVPVVIRDDLEDTGSAKSGKWLCRRMLASFVFRGGQLNRSRD